jgi:hypothetical protein
VYFRCVSGKFEFSYCLKVKSELCSLHSFYQFKHSLSKEKRHCVSAFEIFPLCSVLHDKVDSELVGSSQ